MTGVTWSDTTGYFGSVINAACASGYELHDGNASLICASQMNLPADMVVWKPVEGHGGNLTCRPRPTPAPHVPKVAGKPNSQVFPKI